MTVSMDIAIANQKFSRLIEQKTTFNVSNHLTEGDPQVEVKLFSGGKVNVSHLWEMEAFHIELPHHEVAVITVITVIMIDFHPNSTIPTLLILTTSMLSNSD